jgi:hypothetical protein
MPGAKKPKEEYDEARLSTLTEPITMRVDRLENGSKEPVILPIKPGEAVPGKGFEADDVRRIEEAISTKLCGHGHYVFAATGSNGETMRWERSFHQSRYPTIHKGKVIAPPVQASAAQQPSAYAGPGFLAGLAQPSTPVMPPSQPQLGWPQQPPPANGGSHWLGYQPPPPVYQGNYQSAWQPGGQKDAPSSDRVVRLEEQIQRERLENRYKEQLGGLAQQMNELKQTISAPQKNEELEVVKEQLRQTEQQRASDQTARMIDESARASREMMQQMQAQNQQQMQQMQQMMERMASRPTGPDPTMMLLVETMKASSTAQSEAMRGSNETQKEIARLQAESQREQAKSALGPRDMVDLMRSQNIGQEQLASAYSKVWELMQSGIETVLTAQGPAPNPVFDILGQTAQGALEVGQQYVDAKKQTAMADAQARVASAQAAASRPQLAGPEVPAEVEAEEDVSKPPPPSRDEEFFGEAMEAIIPLRQKVASGEVEPDRCAAAILAGIDHYATKGVNVPAWDLWAEGQLASLVEAMIPQASTSYQERVIQTLFEVRNQMLKQQGQEPEEKESGD